MRYGRENYGFGLGEIELKSLDPTSKNTFAMTDKSFPRVKNVDTHNPVQF